MNAKQQDQFVWYATDSQDGEIILVIPPKAEWKYGYLYAPRIIFERLKGRMNPLLALELNLGPVGFIPRQLYEEAGFSFRVPFWLRMIATLDSHRTEAEKDDESPLLNREGSRISEFMLQEWRKKKSLQK